MCHVAESIRIPRRGIELNDCLIEGTVLAAKTINCVHTFCGDITSASAGVKIASQSKVTGAISAYKGVEVSDSCVEDYVASNTAAVSVKKSATVKGKIVAYLDVDVSRGFVGGSIRSESQGVQLADQAVLKGSISAYSKILASDSFIHGQIVSKASGVHLNNSRCHSKLIQGYKGVNIDHCHLAKGASICSSSQGVTVKNPESGVEKLAEVIAYKNIELLGVSSSTVCSISGTVDCEGGEFDHIYSCGSPVLKDAKIKRLSLLVSPGSDTLIDLRGSELDSLIFTVNDLGTDSMGHASGLYTEAEDRPSCSLSGATMTSTPDSLEVESSPRNEFSTDYRLNVDDIPSSTQEHLQEAVLPALPKVKIIGGRILGQIHKKGALEIDTRETHLLGHFARNPPEKKII
jgi:hypothetical protein